MERKKFNFFPIFMLMTILVPFTVFLALPAQGEEWAAGDKKEIDIGNGQDHSDFPDYFLQVSNLKPGDWVPRTLEVSNNGLRDFTYSARIKNADGDEDFLNTLQIKVTDGNVIFYEGPIGSSEFNLFEERVLPINSGETLQFTVVFPDTGLNQNHLRGKVAEFTLELYAEDYVQTDFGFKKMTGGGTVEHMGAAKQKGSKQQGSSYGFNVMPKSDGLRVELQYNDHDPLTSIETIKITNNAYNVREIVENGKVVGIEFDVAGVVNLKEDARLHVKIVDISEPNIEDLFYLKIINGYQSGDEVTTGGNIQIHY